VVVANVGFFLADHNDDHPMKSPASNCRGFLYIYSTLQQAAPACKTLAQKHGKRISKIFI
jgi:hypothetical protein